ncbi:hypothetical protein PG5_44740 [Pseudomonas sp. G5(2012)]|nr:hypothetical protein PG5_44740 [Pseudomonas sp. G5(2012)]
MTTVFLETYKYCGLETCVSEATRQAFRLFEALSKLCYHQELLDIHKARPSA